MPNCGPGLLLLFSAIAFFAVAVVLFVNAANTYGRQMAKKNLNKQLHENESLAVFFWAILFTYTSGVLFAASIFVMYRGTFLRFSQALAESSDESSSSDDKEHED